MTLPDLTALHAVHVLVELARVPGGRFTLSQLDAFQLSAHAMDNLMQDARRVWTPLHALLTVTPPEQAGVTALDELMRSIHCDQRAGHQSRDSRVGRCVRVVAIMRSAGLSAAQQSALLTHSTLTPEDVCVIATRCRSLIDRIVQAGTLDWAAAFEAAQRSELLPTLTV